MHRIVIEPKSPGCNATELQAVNDVHGQPKVALEARRNVFTRSTNARIGHGIMFVLE